MRRSEKHRIMSGLAGCPQDACTCIPVAPVPADAKCAAVSAEAASAPALTAQMTTGLSRISPPRGARAAVPLYRWDAITDGVPQNGYPQVGKEELRRDKGFPPAFPEVARAL